MGLIFDLFSNEFIRKVGQAEELSYLIITAMKEASNDAFFKVFPYIWAFSYFNFNLPKCKSRQFLIIICLLGSNNLESAQ